MAQQLSRLFLLALLAWPASASNSTCYYPDGTESPADSPCTSSATTHCCNKRNVCLSIGYCMSIEQQPYVLSRGSCTSENWGTGCPTLCSGSGNNPGGGRPISWYGQNSNNQNLYCCGLIEADGGNRTCEDGNDPFTLDTASILYGVGILQNATDDSTATATSATSSATASSAESSTTVAVSTAAPSSSSSTTAVGVGVGVSLGVLSLTALSWALWERRKRVKQVAALEAQKQEYANSLALMQGGEPKYVHQGMPIELSAAPRQLELPTH